MTPATVGLQQTPKPDSGELMKTQEISLDRLERFANEGYLYAIIDACDALLVPLKMKELGLDVAVSLFQGTAQEKYWAVAPYLARVDSSLLRWLVENLWQEPWGIFVFSKATLQDLHKHFRHFFITTLPDGRQWFFRYYDPRILLSYLPTCNVEELRWFFGQVRAFGASNGGKIRLVEPHHGLPNDAVSPLPCPYRIRPEQYSALDAVALNNFELRLTEHLQKFYPEQCETMGLQGIRQLISLCLAKTASYDINIEGDICQYLDLMMAFGPNFETDTQHWAMHILRDPTTRDPRIKIQRLVEHGLQILEQPNG